MSIKSIEQDWEFYKSKCVPEDSGEVQVCETRMAFEAGCMIMFEKMVEIVDCSDEDVCCAEFNKISKEIKLMCKNRLLAAANDILSKFKQGVRND